MMLEDIIHNDYCISFLHPTAIYILIDFNPRRTLGYFLPPETMKIKIKYVLKEYKKKYSGKN